MLPQITLKTVVLFQIAQIVLFMRLKTVMNYEHLFVRHFVVSKKRLV